MSVKTDWDSRGFPYEFVKPVDFVLGAQMVTKTPVVVEVRIKDKFRYFAGYFYPEYVGAAVESTKGVSGVVSVTVLANDSRSYTRL